MDQIKPYIRDEELGIGQPLLYRRDDPERPPERRAEKILARQINDRGESMFLTHWEGTPDSEDTWEPAITFISNCDPVWLNFCWNNNVAVDIMEALEGERGVEE